MRTLAFCFFALILALGIRYSQLDGASGFLLYCAGCVSLVMTGWFTKTRKGAAP